jgi:hypothetical protein
MRKTVLRGRWLVALAVATFLLLGMRVGVAGDDDSYEPIPDIPDGNNDTDEPDADTLDKWDHEQKDRIGWMTYVRDRVAGVIARGGDDAKQFQRRNVFRVAALTECALVFARESFQAVPTIVAKDWFAAPLYFDKVLAVSILLDRRHEHPPESRLAAAYGQLAHAWSEIELGGAVDVPRVTKAIQTVEKLAPNLSPVDPTAWMSFLAALAIADHEAVGEELSALGTKVVDDYSHEHPEDGTRARMAPEMELAKTIALAREDPKANGPALVSALERLAPPEAIEASDGGMTSLYNRGLTTARRLRLSVKAEYRTQDLKPYSQLVVFKRPMLTGWEWGHAEGDQEDGRWVRHGVPGEETVLEIWKYRTDTDYRDPDGKVFGGDNLGAQVRTTLEYEKRLLDKVKKAVPKVGRLSRSISCSHGFELRGTDWLGRDHWVRGWHFKPENRKGYALFVILHITADHAVDDPELEFVMNSFEETPPPDDK